MQPLCQAADAVIPIPVAPDVFDQFPDGPAGRCGRLGGNAGDLAEIGEQGPIEAVEYGEVRLVRKPLALSGPPAQHLLEENSALHRPQKHDELEVRDVDSRGEQVNRNSNAWVRAVPKLPDSLEWSIDPPSDL